MSPSSLSFHSALAAVLAGGFALSFLLLWRRGEPARRASGEALFYAPVVGFGVLSLQSFYWRFFPGTILSWTELGILGCVLAAPLLILAMRRRKPRFPMSESDGRWWGIQMAAGIVVLLLTFHAFTYVASAREASPHGAFDAMAIWTVKARTLSRAGAEFGAVLERQQLGHTDYPLFLPESLAWLFQRTGDESSDIPLAFAVGFAFALAGIAYTSVRRFGNRLGASLAVVILLATPQVLRRTSHCYADVPLACLFLGATAGMALIFHRDRHRRMPPLLVGFLLGGLPWMKNEGLVMATVLLCLFGFFLWRSPGMSGRRLRTFVGVLIGALPGFIAVAIFKWSWAPPSDLISETDSLSGALRQTLDPDRWSLIGRHLWGHVSAGQGIVGDAALRARRPDVLWGAVWPALAVIAIVTGAVWRGVADVSRRFLVCALLMMTVAYVGVYLLTPKDLEWHLSTSLDRLLLHLLPVLVVWIMASLPVGGGKSEIEHSASVHATEAGKVSS